MKTKLVSAVGIALVAMFVLALGVGAEAESGGGTGTLTAQGDGYVAIRGGGEIVLSGNGVLRIRDHAGDADIRIEGRGEHREVNGEFVYAGFDGKAFIRGSDLTVTLAGKNIRLHAQGTGAFFLRGRGTYHTQHESGRWTRDGKTITLL
ncbi:MAG: hypothetical protein HY868_02880 [Chloroflexi bacterium]|nr:hypothetical protein [Chloroflexota bacterium]